MASQGRPKTTRESITQLQREIAGLQGKLANRLRDLDTLSRRLNRAQKKLAAAPPGSEAETQALKDIERTEYSQRSAQNGKALYERVIHDRNRELFRYQAKLASEQDQKHQELLERFRTASVKREREALDAIPRRSREDAVERLDAFISHAAEDKDEVARPLAEQLRQFGIKVWYDDFQLTVGDSLRRKIDDGLARSQYGIVVLSPHFFAKDWPQYELDGLVQKEMHSRQKTVLPLWHKVSKDEVFGYSPTLADKLGLSTSQYTIAELAYKLGMEMLLER